MKPRTARAVPANVGVRRAYRRQMQNLLAEYRDFVACEMLSSLADAHMLAKDSILKPQTPEERKAARELKHQILTMWARSSPAWVEKHLFDFITRNIGRWSRLLGGAAMRVVASYVRKIAFATTEAQRRAFISAKVRRGLLAERWKTAVPSAHALAVPGGAGRASAELWQVPTVQRQHMSARAAEIMPDLVRENADLITRIGTADVDRISSVLQQGLQQGLSYDDLRGTLRATQGFDDARADRVVIDQTNKISQQIQEANARDLGITEAIWVHVPGQYTSRDSHIAMNGRRYNYEEGLFDDVVGQNVHPAQLPFCRCICRFILPDEIMNDED